MLARLTRWIPLALMALSALGVHRARLALAQPFQQLKATSDVYPLPAPEQTVVLSLGYRAALADLLYGHVLVAYGLHFQEKRLFETVGSYLETINELDPKFRSPYMFADTLLVLQPQEPPLSHYRQARDILLRGTRELPFDTRLWMSAGQFLAYLGRPHLKDPQEKERWRLEGARLLARACELQSADEDLPHQCIVAAGILNRAGEHEANIRFLQRFLAVNDDPEVRGRALAYLRRALEARGRDLLELHTRRFERAWRKDLGFVDLDTALVVGPAFDPAICVLPHAAGDSHCATSWRDFDFGDATGPLP